METTTRRLLPTGLIPLIVFIVALGAFHRIFFEFMAPGARLSPDFSLALPALLDGYIWFRNNGLFEVPWFSPSFCGGQPFFADPQSIYYSAPQFLSFVTDPLTASYLTLLIFASLGWWGFYILTRGCFSASHWAALAAATLYMFNGFLPHRMIFGHLGYHAVMLTPWIAWLLCRPDNPLRPWRGLAWAIIAGLLIAYWLQSGLTTLIIPASLGVFAIACIHGLLGGDMRSFFIRSAVAGVVALTLSASKLAAALSFMQSFPRSGYTFGGLEHILDVLRIVGMALFMPGEMTFEAAQPLLVGSHVRLDPPEWTYGFTPVPLFVLITGFALLLVRGWRAHTRAALPSWRTLSLITALILVLAAPVVLSFSSPGWQAFLKTIPVIKSTSTPFRWFILFIPPVALITGLLLDRLGAFARFRAPLAVAICLSIIALVSIEDRSFYRWDPEDASRLYSPQPIVSAWRRLHDGDEKARIDHVFLFRDQTGTPARPRFRNDTLVAGGSQLLCYNPIFGYDLEYFPRGTLHPGPVMQPTDGYLNLKNPACYVFPEENACRPGDHFRADQAILAEAFVGYRPWAFARSPLQRIADWVTLGGIAGAVIGILAFWGFRRRPPSHIADDISSEKAP